MVQTSASFLIPGLLTQTAKHFPLTRKVCLNLHSWAVKLVQQVPTN